MMKPGGREGDLDCDSWGMEDSGDVRINQVFQVVMRGMESVDAVMA